MLVLGALGGGPDARPLPVTVQDDALMLHRGGAEVQATARRMASLGVDSVRLTASWSTLAPEPESKRVPKFDATNSDAYPRESFMRLDRAVKAVTSAGMTPQIDIAFFAPRWGVRREVRITHPGRHRWEIRTKRYARFAEAVAMRYNGTHRDPARSSEQLPAVRLWATWNEPNHSAFFLPQWRRYQGKWVPRSPHLYRKLHERGYAAIKRVDPTNQVLIGNTAALGGTAIGPRRTIAPLRFIRELACVDRRGRPLEDRLECENFKPLQADGLAHHPYSLYDRPDVPSVHPDQITMGDLGRLSALLDRLHKLGRTTTRLPILITEYGYETNPPDQFRGVSLRQQARYHGFATFLAWRQQDVTSFAQFLMNDIPPPPGAGQRPRGERTQLAERAVLPRRPRETAGDPGVQNALLGGGSRAGRPGSGPAVRPGAPGRRPPADGGRDAGAGRELDAGPHLRDAAGRRLGLRVGHDVLPHRHRGLLPARCPLPRADDVPRALDQARRVLRVRGDGPRARDRSDYGLTTTFIRMFAGWISQSTRHVPTRRNVCVNLPSVLKSERDGDLVAAGLLERDVVDVVAPPAPA